jgi:hypothetical protein
MIIRNAFTNRPEKRHKRGATSPVIERLEDRLVLTNPYTGLMLIANASAGTDNYQGIVGVDPSCGTEYGMVSILTTNNGNKVYPADVTEQTDTSGGGTYYETLFVADLGDNSGTDGNGGGIIEIPLSGGSYNNSPLTWITTAHPYNGLVYINGYIYAIAYGDGAGSFHSLYTINPSGGRHNAD